MFRTLPLRYASLPALLAVAGCVGAPELGPKPNPIAPQQVAAERSLAADPAAAWPDEAWWNGIGDAQLSALIEEGLAKSPDVAAAAARFRRASGLAQEAGAPLLPSLDIKGDAGLDKQSYNVGFPKEFVPKGWKDTGQIAANLGFDLDLWGRNRAALAAATSEQRATAVDAQQARLMLSTGIALAYFDLDRLFAERDVRQAALEARTATQRLVGGRLANGLDTRGSLRQAEAGVATARSELAAAELAVTIRRNQIAALVGAGPDRGLDIAPPTQAASAAPGLPAGVTTDLVGRRPDIVALRERVEAAASRIRVARADFFPAIRLDALVGFQSLGLGNLAEKDSLFGSVGPAISLPIFHGGALKGRYTAQRGAYDLAVADYDKAVLDAYRQVADAVASQRLIGARLADVRAALEASEEAYKIARLRYEGGLSNYLDVLVVEDRLLTARLVAAFVEGEAQANRINMIRALGGGFAGTAAAPFKDDSHG